MPSDRRSAVLSVMRDLGRAASAEEIAAALGVHPNTVRFHLRRLVADGSAEQTVDTRVGRGRPRQLFMAAADRGARNYLMLARMLAQTAAETGDAALAERTGHTWGRQLLAEAGARPSKRRATVAAHLETVLDSIGFAPAIGREGAGLRVDLRHCPFLEVAREQPGLICGMHQALIQGVLSGLESGMQVEDLRPFVAPSLCTARVV